MKIGELSTRWPEDVARLQRFRTERNLDDWLPIAAEVVPTDLAPLIDLVSMLSMRWADVLELESKAVLSTEFVTEVAKLLVSKEEQLHKWDISTQSSDRKGVWALSNFREALDTALFLATGKRYLDEHVRT